MVHIDIIRCTGCGYCVDACPQGAITIQNSVASIRQDQCTKCGSCAEVCPVGAIREVVPAHVKLSKGGDSMVCGFGRGFGRRGRVGFGFRGSSPPWPYFGRGRSWLPRCWYPGGSMSPFYSPVPPAYAPQMPQEQEIDWLKRQAEAVKAELNQIEARIQDLESTK